MTVSKGLDMCNGPIFSKLLLYSLPLAATGVLQLLYNAADLVVVGRFTGDNALAAVGATTALVNMITSLFLGLSVGVTAVVARHDGADDNEKMQKSIHTAMTLSIISGIIVMVIGLILCKPLLILMDTPSQILPLSVLYLRIYFLGMPATMVYNFGAGVLRAVGDTQRPLIFLSSSGLVNVLLNLLLVVGLKRGVDGVAVATVVSQILSAVMVVIFLLRHPGDVRLTPSKLRLHCSSCFDILRIGIPAGIQSALFSISNVLIQSSVNGFGPIVVAGNTAASNIDSFIGIIVNSFSQAALTFTGQNLGAKKPERISLILRQTSLLVVLFGLFLGGLCVLFKDTLLGFYTTDPEAIKAGTIHLQLLASPYFIAGLMEVISGVLRGMGYSASSMFISLFGVCGFRIFWIYVVFKASPTMFVLFSNYPVSWALTTAALYIFYFYARKRLHRQLSTSF